MATYNIVSVYIFVAEPQVVNCYIEILVWTPLKGGPYDPLLNMLMTKMDPHTEVSGTAYDLIIN